MNARHYLPHKGCVIPQNGNSQKQTPGTGAEFGNDAGTFSFWSPVSRQGRGQGGGTALVSLSLQGLCHPRPIPAFPCSFIGSSSSSTASSPALHQGKLQRGQSSAGHPPGTQITHPGLQPPKIGTAGQGVRESLVPPWEGGQGCRS